MVHTGVHYYVDVRNSDDSAHPPGDKNEEIDPGCHEHLQETCEPGDISTFLALPEIILARQRRRPQPLLDFTKSKILTSCTYTELCERLLAQKEATLAEAKRKANLREATKKTRRREKAEHELEVRARKEARSAKREERLREEAEKRLRGTGQCRQSSGVPLTPESPPRSPQVDGDQFPPRTIVGISACGASQTPNPTLAPDSCAHPAFRAPPLPQIPWPQDSFQPPPPFWNNPLLGMPHMFHHPLLSHHNGNSHWVPQLSMPGAGDVKAAPNFQGVQLLADDVATSRSHRHGVGTWQGTHSGR